MNIKERFYANLEMIREDYDKNAAEWSKKYNDNAKFEKGQAKANHLLARISPEWKKEHNKKSKHYKNVSKKYAKKAVTGMDEEVEQKSKDKKKKKRSLPPMSREMERDKSIPNSLEAYRDRMYQARKKMLRKEETEQLNEGPFGTIGKRLMKRKLKKQIDQHNDKMDDISWERQVPGMKSKMMTPDQDARWAKEYDTAARKRKALKRLSK